MKVGNGKYKKVIKCEKDITYGVSHTYIGKQAKIFDKFSLIIISGKERMTSIQRQTRRKRICRG